MAGQGWGPERGGRGRETQEVAGGSLISQEATAYDVGRRMSVFGVSRQILNKNDRRKPPQ